MQHLNPEQQKKIVAWAEQRDALLREIGIAETELAATQLAGKEAANSLTDIQNRLAEARGRLAELDALEERTRTSVKQDIAELTAQKSRLEGDVEAKKIEVAGLSQNKNTLIESINALTSAHATLFDKISVMEGIVSRVKEVSGENISEIKTIFAELKTSCENIIAINGDNVENAKIILEKLPKFVFEMQKPVVRRIIERREIERVPEQK